MVVGLITLNKMPLAVIKGGGSGGGVGDGGGGGRGGGGGLGIRPVMRGCK